MRRAPLRLAGWQSSSGWLPDGIRLRRRNLHDHCVDWWLDSRLDRHGLQELAVRLHGLTELVDVGIGEDHVRREKQEKLARRPVALLVAEQPSESGDPAQSGDARLTVRRRIVREPANHRRLAVANEDLRGRLALVD